MLDASYYRKAPGDDIGKTYHSHCGDPFGTKAKIKRLTAALIEMRDRDNRNGSLPPAYREIIDAALTGNREGET